jgi:hypothetical protein
MTIEIIIDEKTLNITLNNVVNNSNIRESSPANLSRLLAMLQYISAGKAQPIERNHDVYGEGWIPARG